LIALLYVIHVVTEFLHESTFTWLYRVAFVYNYTCAALEY
jgi:hypothetical protein